MKDSAFESYFETCLLPAVARRYRTSGVSHRRFALGKLRHDPMYRAILRSQVLPREGRLIDVGCGRGILLTLLDVAREQGGTAPAPPGWRPPSERLELFGLELRPKMAAVARRALRGTASIETVDAGERPLPPASAIVLLDVLHYLPAAAQETLLENVAGALEPGGVVVVREADAALGRRFLLTHAAERCCALARGHWRQRFHFRGAAEWRRLLEAGGLTVSDRPMWAGTPYANRLIEARKPA